MRLAALRIDEYTGSRTYASLICHPGAPASEAPKGPAIVWLYSQTIADLSATTLGCIVKANSIVLFQFENHRFCKIARYPEAWAQFPPSNQTILWKARIP
jgi:hypothetical protein